MDVEQVAAKAREALLSTAPEHVRRLGGILRGCIESGKHDKLKTFLEEEGLDVDVTLMGEFRDVLIVGRIDLMDLVPAARERLRTRTLANQPQDSMTDEYRAAEAAGKKLHCRDCRYFVVPPRDGTDEADKACVEFGTKGIDKACFGFLSS